VRSPIFLRGANQELAPDHIRFLFATEPCKKGTLFGKRSCEFRSQLRIVNTSHRDESSRLSVFNRTMHTHTHTHTQTHTHTCNSVGTCPERFFRHKEGFKFVGTCHKSDECCRRSPSAFGTVYTKHVHVRFILNKTVNHPPFVPTLLSYARGEDPKNKH